MLLLPLLATCIVCGGSAAASPLPRILSRFGDTLCPGQVRRCRCSAYSVVPGPLPLAGMVCRRYCRTDWCTYSLPLMPSVQHHRPAGSLPPTRPPVELQPLYTRCGAIAEAEYYVDDSLGGAGSHYKFGAEGIQALIIEGAEALDTASRGHRRLPPKHRECIAALGALTLAGKRVIVFGSVYVAPRAPGCARQAADSHTHHPLCLPFVRWWQGPQMGGGCAGHGRSVCGHGGAQLAVV